MSCSPSFIRRGILALSGCVFLSVASAQENPGDKEKKVSHGIRFVCAAIAKDTPETLKLMSKKGLVDVPLSTRSPGALFSVPAEGGVALGLETGDKEHPFTALALARMPEGMTRATAILFPREKQADGTCYRVLLIDDKDLKGGDVYFLNTLQQRCAVRLDDEEFFLSSGKPLIHHTKGARETHNSPVAISVERPEPVAGKKEWELITASTWNLMPSRIEVCVIYMNQEYKRPALKGLTFFSKTDEAMP
jgi:hypothetical protein